MSPDTPGEGEQEVGEAIKVSSNFCLALFFWHKRSNLKAIDYMVENFQN